MSQRLHNCINSIIMDPVHCDSYPTRFPKRGKQDSVVNRLCQQPKRERSVSRNRHATSVPAYVPKTKSSNVKHSGDLKSESIVPSVIHRELYTDNPAMVEVTVKTHNAKQRSESKSRPISTRSRSREPWSKLLKQPSSEILSSFHNFDPLRTVHFLAKELQTKLGGSNDRALQQMVVEMQQALNRVPPEIASSVFLSSPREQTPKKYSHLDLKQLQAKSITKENEEPIAGDIQMVVVKPPTRDISCQTLKNNFEAERLQKHLEESSAKIEAACKQMENVCTRLKSEKEELEIMLRAERETVKFLRKEMEEFDSEKIESANAKIMSLQQERDSLQSQLKKLRVQLDSQQNMSSIDLKTLVQDLRKQKTEGEEQIAILNHQLTLVSMEKEKYVAILSARDRQIKEIRSEMTQLQEVVNEQLVELQNAPCSSVPSSITNMTSAEPSWIAVKPENHKKNDTADNLTPSSINTNESTLEQLFLKDKLPASSFKELPSGDSSGTTVMEEVQKALKDMKDAAEKRPHKANEKSSVNKMVISETHANIRDMFAEIKKQALLVTAPLHRQKMNDINAFHSEQTVQKKSS